MTASLFPDDEIRLTRWAPESWAIAADWQSVAAPFLAGPTARQLGQFIQSRLDQGVTIYPSQPFRALELTPLEQVRVVILGQDPYHGAGQAQGLAFSVAPGVKIPPSLRNIFKEIAQDPGLGASAKLTPVDGSLQRWAKQGVLLLNTCLTVEEGAPASHAQKGWEQFTNDLIKAVAMRASPVVFMLWGAHAQSKLSLIEAALLQAGLPTDSCLVLTANHPSPLSALRAPKPFIGCGHFGQSNAFLKRNGGFELIW